MLLLDQDVDAKQDHKGVVPIRHEVHTPHGASTASNESQHSAPSGWSAEQHGFLRQFKEAIQPYKPSHNPSPNVTSEQVSLPQPVSSTPNSASQQTVSSQQQLPVASTENLDHLNPRDIETILSLQSEITNPTLSVTRKVMACAQLGWYHHHRTGMMDKAFAYYRMASAHGHVGALAGLACIYHAKGDYQTALPLYMQLVKSNHHLYRIDLTPNLHLLKTHFCLPVAVLLFDFLPHSLQEKTKQHMIKFQTKPPREILQALCLQSHLPLRGLINLAFLCSQTISAFFENGLMLQRYLRGQNLPLRK